MNSTTQYFDLPVDAVVASTEAVKPVAGPTSCFAPQSAAFLLVGAVAGTVGAVLVVALAGLLPAGQTHSALAALAAGIAVPLLWLSVDDDLTARALFRAAVAVTSALLAYQSLSWGVPLLGLAYVVALAWVVMDWIAAGASPLRLALTSGLASLAALSVSMV